MAGPTNRVGLDKIPPGSIGTSGSNVKTEPFDHLIQPLKQGPKPPTIRSKTGQESLNVTQDDSYHRRLYEALKKIGQSVNNLATAANNPTPAPTFQDKATFGIVKVPTVVNGLTNFYICRKAGTFTDCVGKVVQAPTFTVGDPGTSGTIFNIAKSTDDGVTFSYIMQSGLNFINGNTIIVPQFIIPSIALGDILRIDCSHVASNTAGAGFEIVLRWT